MSKESKKYRFSVPVSDELMNQIEGCYQTLNCSSRAEAIKKLIQLGLDSSGNNEAGERSLDAKKM